MTKKMSIEEFRESGLLQEVNRRFFHPIGLALAVDAPDDTDSDEVKAEGEKLACIYDSRDDPEGFVFWMTPEDAEQAIIKAARYDAMVNARARVRDQLFRPHHSQRDGFTTIQPLSKMTKESME